MTRSWRGSNSTLSLLYRWWCKRLGWDGVGLATEWWRRPVLGHGKVRRVKVTCLIDVGDSLKMSDCSPFSVHTCLRQTLAGSRTASGASVKRRRHVWRRHRIGPQHASLRTGSAAIEQDDVVSNHDILVVDKWLLSATITQSPKAGVSWCHCW